MDKLNKQENALYAVAWAVVFALVPLLYLLQALSQGDPFSWDTVFQNWLGILPFLVLFLLHNALAAPLLLKKKYPAYIAVTLVLLVLFAVYCFSAGNRPPQPEPGIPPMGGPFGWEDGRPAPPDSRRPMTPEVMKVIMGVLVLAVNLGVKAMFNALRSEQKMQELRAENLGKQLEMLRYQINPHFFMNTLNNIHALVDIDPEKAKESIEEFSKLMRIVLYDGTAPTIPLQRELDFLRHYVSLMRLRYPDSVSITLSVPDKANGAEVPPLVMASFVENAFKHGISYEEPSSIAVSVALENRQIVFRCTNTVHAEKAAEAHGIGLENVRKRLDLMYGGAYTLQIGQEQDRFSVLLVLPEREAAV